MQHVEHHSIFDLVQKRKVYSHPREGNATGPVIYRYHLAQSTRTRGPLRDGGVYSLLAASFLAHRIFIWSYIHKEDINYMEDLLCAQVHFHDERLEEFPAFDTPVVRKGGVTGA
jgi:hypothetical protein